MSFIVATNGPVAIAGSAPSLFSNSGIVEPITVEKIMMTIKEIASISEKIISALKIKCVAISKIDAQTSPFNKPTKNSLNIFFML